MRQRKKRYGLEDVARLAGVGIASVDRVLNERGGVSAKTERQILDAARELGLRRILPAPHMGHLIIEVILARSTSPFMVRLGTAMERVAATLDRSMPVQTTYDDSERAYHHVKKFIQDHSDLAAVYNTGGGNEGVGYALRGTELEQAALFVGHELTDESAVLLKDGIMTMTIDH